MWDLAVKWDCTYPLDYSVQRTGHTQSIRINIFFKSSQEVKGYERKMYAVYPRYTSTKQNINWQNSVIIYPIKLHLKFLLIVVPCDIRTEATMWMVQDTPMSFIALCTERYVVMKGFPPRFQHFARIVLDIEFDNVIQWKSTWCPSWWVSNADSIVLLINNLIYLGIQTDLVI